MLVEWQWHTMTISNYNAPGRGLLWPPLLQGTLIWRYQRFKADVKLRNGRIVTAHCPNSGSMQTCCEPGRTVYLSRSANPARKLPYTWEMIEMPSSLVGINTSIPNRLVERAVLDGEIPELLGYGSVRREVWCSRESRLDLLLESPGRGRCRNLGLRCGAEPRENSAQ